MDKNKIAGWVSLVLGILEVIGFLLVYASGLTVGSPISLISMLGFFYIFYRTLIKRQKLSKYEWVAIIFLVVLFFGGIVLGVLTGLGFIHL